VSAIKTGGDSALCKKERMKAKISKLLAFAASTSNTHERDNATSKAMAYMNEYRLSMDDLESPTLSKEKFNHTGIKISNSDAIMATVIAKVLGVHVSYLQGFSTIKGLFFYSGEPSDIEFSRYVFEVASAQIVKKAKEHRLSLGGAPVAYMNSYRTGLKIGFTSAFEKLHKVDNVTGTSDNTGLVVLNNRYALACENAGSDFKADKRKIKQDKALIEGLKDSEDIAVNTAINGESLAPKELGFSA
jgi:hypothetical protein